MCALSLGRLSTSHLPNTRMKQQTEVNHICPLPAARLTVIPPPTNTPQPQTRASREGEHPLIPEWLEVTQSLEFHWNYERIMKEPCWVFVVLISIVILDLWLNMCLMDQSGLGLWPPIPEFSSSVSSREFISQIWRISITAITVRMTRMDRQPQNSPHQGLHIQTVMTI